MRQRCPNMMQEKVWMVLGLLAIFLVLEGGCTSQPDFQRVEEYPEGMQIDTTASAWSNKLHTTRVSDRYSAGFDEVWAATKRVAQHFEKLHGEPIVKISEKDGRIEMRGQHRVNRAKEYNPDAERIEGWKDEFLIKVVALDRTRTKVTISRTVVGIPSFRICRDVLVQCGELYEPEVSNAKIEDWFLTKIEDDLASTAEQPAN